MNRFKALLFTAVFLCCTAAFAESVVIDGITYSVITEAKTATVSQSVSKYSGEIVIPEAIEHNGVTYSVTSIENKAFLGCSGLTSIVIPNSVTHIGNEAFYGCSSLTSVVIPNSVTSIGSGAFYYCFGLTSVVIGNSVTSIGSYAFYGCSGLTNITIPNSVTSIGNNAFSGTAWYNNQPDGVVYAGKVLYEYKGTMPQNNEIIVKDGILGIGDYAFYKCSGLTSIVIPNSVTNIGSYAFYDCSKLTSIEIPNSVTSIGNDAFSGCSGLTSIVIPNSVTSIGNYAFDGCSGLTSITIPNSVTSIGDDAFRDCSGLTSIEIPNSVTNIGSYAFENCFGITSIEIPNSVTSIGDSAFYKCSGLTSIVIPNSVTSIGERAFNKCSGLTSIVVAEGNAKYDSRENCNAIIETATNALVAGCKNTIIPNSVTSIGSGAFEECSGLTSIEIPNSVTSIGDYAFNGCSGLTSIVVAEGNAKYDSRENCNAIIETATNTLVAGCKNTIIPNSVTSIGNFAFDGCSGLTSIEIPNSVTSIGSGAFSGCSGFTSIEIPNSVTSIGSYAFWNCDGLASVTIGSGIEHIDRYAFSKCRNLTDIYCLATIVPIASTYTFKDAHPENITLHVPAEAVNDYKTKEPWSSFGTIAALDDTEVENLVCAIPIITYSEGKLTIECETEGAEFVTSVTCDYINTYYTSSFELAAIYNISVYATAAGHENSETVNVTLCWIDNGDCNNENSVINIPATAVLVTSVGGTITIVCEMNGEKVEIYTTDGVMTGSAIIDNGTATVNTGLEKGSIAIVNIAGKSIKVIVG